MPTFTPMSNDALGIPVPKNPRVGILQEFSKDLHPTASILAVDRNTVNIINATSLEVYSLQHGVGMDVRYLGLFPDRLLGRLVDQAFSAIDFDQLDGRYSVNPDGEFLAVAVGEGHFPYTAYPGIIDGSFTENESLIIPKGFLVASHVPKPQVHAAGIPLI